MYNLLVVDDEDYIVDGLITLFEETYQETIHYYRAYSPFEAIEMLESTKMDIVVSDIRMPGMTGLVLHEQIIRLWPSCKMIFLTGYNDFNYIQTALRNDSINYILKTESDEIIVQAVDKALDLLRSADEAKQLMELAKKQMQASLPILQQQYIGELLNGSAELAALPGQLLELQLPLEAELPVLMLLGRLENRDNIGIATVQSSQIYAVSTVVDRYFHGHAQWHGLFYEQTKWVWLIQPQSGAGRNSVAADGTSSSWETLKHRIANVLTHIQSDCMQHLQLKLSLLAAGEPVSWAVCSAEFARMKAVFYTQYGMQQQMAAVETDLPTRTLGHDSKRFYELRPNHWLQLQSYLEKGQIEPFRELFREVTGRVRADQIRQDELWLQIYHSLLSIFFSHIYQSDQRESWSAWFEYDQLLYGHHQTWGDISAKLWQLAASIFHKQQHQLADREREVVRKVRQYIQSNLGGVLSLEQLSKIAGYNHSYLSRLYKETTGEGLTEYITNERLTAAKKRLCEPDQQIQEVAESLGFESPTYFTRFFKKHTGMTPTEYREFL
ncbi:helix-turn-helix domain-containing protein [Paenibacillus eucommiae]|uniref:Two-component system response regulator YesN n=1 Tax=Paenibacillus eucommiae TaxID=1355755 RepID=A0ABS4IZL8_9BACL|nr:helix-turn-helix domain-containing protein [Paenibacillus eucommiae]MBP1992431.1 two-component system response regulator YesN [Paenibacillus eucommiae]